MLYIYVQVYIYMWISFFVAKLHCYTYKLCMLNFVIFLNADIISLVGSQHSYSYIIIYMYLWMWTSLVCPMRWQRSAACCSRAGFQCRSSRNTWQAPVRLSPTPPACSDSSITCSVRDSRGGARSAWLHHMGSSYIALYRAETEIEKHLLSLSSCVHALCLRGSE